MIKDTILIIDKDELTEYQAKYISGMSEITYIESNHSYFIYFDELESDILDSIIYDEDDVEEIQELCKKIEKYIDDNKISKTDLKILITL